MNCPNCGMKVKDPDLSTYCPACGKPLPVITRDMRNDVAYQRLSVIFLILGLMFLMIGLSLLLPEVIIAYIVGLDGHTLYWPIQIYLIVAGIIFMVARRPFAKRRAVATVQLISEMQNKFVCSYCGKSNAPGAQECESCGAPLK